jgi:hypothetical protein
VTVIETVTTKFDDPRIAKLPLWAQQLMQAAKKAEKSAVYWNEQYDAKSAELDAAREGFARTNGAAGSNTWVEIDKDDYESARFGLGTSRTVEFGDPDDSATFTVNYVDGGLNIDVHGQWLLRPIPAHRPGELRIELQ